MIKGSVEALGYLDLLLLHFPCAAAHLAEGEPRNGRWYGEVVAENVAIQEWRAETWRTMEEFVKEGSIQSLGVSNFQVGHISHVLSICDVPPALNQIELHPANLGLETALLSYCAQEGIKVAAYCPLRKGDRRLLEDDVIQAIASGHCKTSAQVLLRWSVQKGFVALPKSAAPLRIAENIDILDFELTADEVGRIDQAGAALYPEGKQKRLWCSAEMGVP